MARPLFVAFVTFYIYNKKYHSSLKQELTESRYYKKTMEDKQNDTQGVNKEVS